MFGNKGENMFQNQREFSQLKFREKEVLVYHLKALGEIKPKIEKDLQFLSNYFQVPKECIRLSLEEGVLVISDMRKVCKDGEYDCFEVLGHVDIEQFLSGKYKEIFLKRQKRKKQALYDSLKKEFEENKK